MRPTLQDLFPIAPEVTLEQENHSRINHHMPGMRAQTGRDNANRYLSVVLRMQSMWRAAQTQKGRLLRFLLLRIAHMSARSARRCFMLFVIAVTELILEHSHSRLQGGGEK